MSKLLTYNSFEDKKPTYARKPLSKEEALIRALDLLDFQAALSSQNTNKVNDTSTIDWIELQWVKDDK
ncbi:hypothetical protein [Roseivirga sp.]|uniref:hypothetical protein n=1 Tax=Roseivirga sp. TaxID=1964215 RepID=UPI002B275930|nr:hypothetical protein [Roseivirga sp.]